MSANVLVSIYGPVYFATILTTAFYGITCMQTFFYYVHYQNDPLRTKSFVAVIWALNTIHQVLTVYGAYKYIMTGLGDPASVLDETTELVILPTNVVSILAQGFFVYRIYIFSKKNIIAPLIWITLGIIQTVTVTIYLAKALYSANGVQAVNFSVLDEYSLVTLGSICLSVSAGVDVLIAMFMTFLLVRERTVTHFAKTTHILQRLTVFAVNTGTWTATFALLTVIFMHVFSFSSNIVYVVFLVPLCPVYCNTLLANLNARVYIGNRGETTDYFTSSSLPVSDTSKPSKQHGSVLSPKEGVWRTTEVVTFLDVNQSMTELTNV